MEILVFKTNLVNTNCVQDIEPYLQEHPHIHRWNVDLKDCDNILRIETERLPGKEIEAIVARAGYYCKEL